MYIKTTDEEFIAIWRELKSPSLVAKRLGVSIRNAYARRDAIECRHSIELKTKPNDKAEVQVHSGRSSINIDNGTVIVFSDAHYWPGIISTAHRALLLFVENMKPAAVICNGDAFDGGAISRFPRIGWDSKPTVVDELKAVTERLTEVEDRIKQKLFWNLGNHDARYETFLAARVPEFQGIAGFTLKEHFPRWTPAWSTWINESNPMGRTVVKHRYKGGIHATHNNTVNGGVNFVTGHLHSLKVTPFTDYNGTRWGVDTGTLAEPNGAQFMDYTEDGPKNHRDGFAVLTYYNGELLWPELVHVRDDENGIVEFRGEVIKV